MNKLIAFVVFVVFLIAAGSVNGAEIKYQVDGSIFPNPERGWRYHAHPIYGPDVPSKGVILGPHKPFTVAELVEWRNQYEGITLFQDCIKIQQWKGDIPKSRLEELDADYAVIRKAGIKSIIRLVYNWGMTKDSPSEDVISRHLDQLAPFFKKNADVIYCVQFGLFGGTGEAVDSPGYTTEKGNNGSQSLTPAAICLYKKLAKIVPKDRMLTIHYPRYKLDMMGWDDGNIWPKQAKPLTKSNAFDGSLQSRIGFYNDNYSGDANHWGFYYGWPVEEKKFQTEDSKYVIMEGEISAATDYNMKYGVKELKKYRFSVFHWGGDDWKTVMAAWKKNGEYDDACKYLGYRFRLISASIPKKVSAKGKLNFSIVMANDGWTRIMNPRDVEIILRNNKSGKKYVIKIDNGKGNRLWLPGGGETKKLEIKEKIPYNITKGKYELLLNLPDPYPSIHNRPEYSIRLANKYVWEAKTGYNTLNHILVIIK